MWFRNLLIYRLTQDLQIDAATLEQALASKPARPCESQEMTTYGFGAPFGKGPDAHLVHASHGFLLIATRKQERILPGSVVRDELAEKVEQIETDQMRKVFKKERDQLKDEIVQALLPRAFIRKSSTFAALDLERGLVLVDTNSAKKAEDLLSTLREALGSLPVRPVGVKVAPSATLTDWMKSQAAGGDFHVLDSAVLADTHEDGGKVVATRQDLTSEEMQLHLTAGKLVTQASLAWSDKLSFVIDDKLSIRRLRFEDMLQEKALQDGGEEAAGQFDASFVLMMLTFREFLPALFESLGGEFIPEGIDGEQPEARPAAGGGIDVTKALGLGNGVTATLLVPGADVDGDDPMYPEAVRFVRESRRASISAVQRKLLIGYNRAARLIEAMEMAGVVTPMNTNGSREVIGHG